MQGPSQVHGSVVLLAVGLLAVAGLASAQTPVSIGGRVITPDSVPLAGARVTATVVGAVTSRSDSTDARGSYAIVVPGGGDRFVVHVALAGYAPQQRTVARQPGDTGAIRADFRLVAEGTRTLATVRVVGRRPRPARSDLSRPPEVGTGAVGAESVDLTGLRSGDPGGDLALALATIPGLTLVPDPNGGPPAISVLGLPADQNNVTVNGVTVDPASLPVYGSGAIVRASAGSFDPGQRGGSGAHVSFTIPRGLSYPLHSLNATLEHPWAQWADPLAPGDGGRFTRGLVSGGVSGPLARNLFYHARAQLTRRSSDLATLASASPATLQTLGLGADSAARALEIAQALGIPARTGAVPDDQLATAGSAFARLDWDRDSSTTLGIMVNGARSGAGAFGGPTALPAAGRDVGSWSLAATPRVSRYLLGGAMLNETSLALSASASRVAPYLGLPGAQVRVDSRLADGAAGSAAVLLGGSPGGTSDSRRSSAQLRSVTSWYTMDRRHLFDVTLDGLLQRSRSTQQPGPGTFAFASLADLEAARPASFTRTLGTQSQALTDASWLVGAADTYTPFPGLRLRYGAQLLGTLPPTRPAHNPRVEALFGRRTDDVPGGVALSPMLSFDWEVGTTGAPAAAGGPPARRFGTLSGNLARRRGVIGAATVDAVARSTGLPGSLAQLTCVGAAAPTPDWDAYHSADGTAPTTCADGTGASPLAQATPPVALLAPDYAAPLTWDANLGWTRPLGALTAVVGLTYRRTTDLPGTFDLNFEPAPRFALADEANRPVYVSPASIDPASGAVSARESRRSDEFARVSELRSDGAAEARQLRLALSGRLPSRFGLAGYGTVSYVHARLRERTRGFAGTTAGDPRDLAWGRSPADARHQITAGGTLRVRDWFGVTLFGTFRSPTPFTPRVGGDVNGDGLANDQAFVFDPATAADPVVAEGMAALLATNPAARRCLRGQLGTVARRGSCTGGRWTSLVNLQVVPGGDGIDLGERTRVTFDVTNVLGAVDRLLHGAHGLRGWGQWAQGQASDPTLLHVRGFDPATRRFRYRVNPAFASDAAVRTAFRTPFRVTLAVRMRFGANMESVRIAETLRPAAGGGVATLTVEQIEERVAPRAPTVPQRLVLLRDSLALTPAQVDSLTALDRRLSAAHDAIFRALAEYLATLGGDYDAPATRLRWRRASTDAEQAWVRLAPATEALLTPEQRRKLPSFLRQMIEAAVREAAGGSDADS